MKVAFDIQHPAQVHLFKHAIRDLEAAGHETLVLSRDKEVTHALLDAYDIDHVSLSRRRGGLPAAILELAVREIRTALSARRFDPDVFVSRVSPPAVHAAALVDAASVVVTDTDIEDTLLGRAYHAVTLPLADVICRPPDLGLTAAREKQYVLAFQELAYLHPERFSPSTEALAAHGVAVDEPYFVMRLAGWDAYHDVGRRGIDQVTMRELASYLSAHGTLYVSAEGEVPDIDGMHPLPTPPHLIHDLLYHADLYVGDSGTMSTEAAMLGTPAVRTNSTAGESDEHTFVALEREYGLLYSYRDGRDAVRKVRELVENGDTAAEWQTRRDRLLGEATDVTGELVRLVRDAARPTPG